MCFTPSLLDEGTLERLFVNREHLLSDALTRIERLARGHERAHRLFVGPRGSGKTHLISVIYHQARRLEGFGTAFQLAWLPEDPWRITSLEDVLGEILDHLEPAVEGHTRSGRCLDDLFQAARRHGPVVVLVENLDQVLEAIGRESRLRLGALLKTQSPMLLIATAIRSTEDPTDDGRLLPCTFDTTMLEPFNLDEAATMLEAMAIINDDQPLFHRLGEARLRARLAAVEQLAGGQPRVWALLAGGLSGQGLANPPSALVQRFDNLTPYYQEQLARLSVNERQVVQVLADAGRATAVRALAEITGIEQGSLTETLVQLRRLGWVRPRTGVLAERVDRRVSFYELAEPMARVAMRIKATRGQPVKALLDFLTAWFEEDEAAPPMLDPSPGGTYRKAANEALAWEPLMLIDDGASSPGVMIRRSFEPTGGRHVAEPSGRGPDFGAVLRSLDDAVEAYQRNDAGPLLEQPTELSRLVEQRLGETTATRIRLRLGRLALAGDKDDDVSGWTSRLEDTATRADDEERVVCLVACIHAHLRVGQDDLAVMNGREAVEALALMPSAENCAAMISGAEALTASNHLDPALDVLDAVHPIAPVEQWLALTTARQAVHYRRGEPGQAVSAWEEATAHLSDSLGAEHPATLTARANLAGSCWSVERTGEAIAWFEEVVAERESLLGPEHPATLTARANLATSYGLAERTGDAISILVRVVAEGERLLGPEHPAVLTARANLAGSYWSAGGTAEAMTTLERVVDDDRRLLGPDHPHALTRRKTLEQWRLAGSGCGPTETASCGDPWAFAPGGERLTTPG